MKLNLGAGSVIRDGWVNVDIAPLPGVDVVWDLDVAPWPWPDGAARAIEAKDIFEHLARPVQFMTEAHRVLRAGGQLHIRAPHWLSPDAWTDPTHRRAVTEHTWDFWIANGNPHYEANNAAYGGVEFDLCRRLVDRGAVDITLRKPARP